MKIKEATQANGTGTSQSILFHQPSKTAEPDHANALVDPRAIARHYVVKSTSLSNGPLDGGSPPGTLDETKSGIKRHYTEAFAMRP